MNNDTPRITPVMPSQIGDLIRIGEETKLSPWSAEHYLEEIKNPRAIMLRLVSEENETLGFVVGRLVLGGESEVRADAEIYNVAVVNAQQNKGYGQRLLDSFFERCSKRGTEYVWLEVRESNHKAIAFYVKNGFEQVQSRPNFYNDPREAALLMRLKLPPKKS
jgi:ribosomal-protein-alanine N-acetyltransferase